MPDDTTIEIDPEQLRATVREVVREELARIDAEWPDPDAEAGAGVPAKGRVRVSGGGTTASAPDRDVDSLEAALEQARQAGAAELVADQFDADFPTTLTDGADADADPDTDE